MTEYTPPLPVPCADCGRIVTPEENMDVRGKDGKIRTVCRGGVGCRSDPVPENER